MANASGFSGLLFVASFKPKSVASSVFDNPGQAVVLLLSNPVSAGTVTNCKKPTGKSNLL